MLTPDSYISGTSGISGRQLFPDAKKIDSVEAETDGIEAGFCPFFENVILTKDSPRSSIFYVGIEGHWDSWDTSRLAISIYRVFFEQKRPRLRLHI